MHESDANRAFSGSRRDALRRVAPHVTDGEHTWDRGLELQKGRVVFRWSGDDESPVVTCHVRRKPVSEGLGADEDKERCGRERVDCSRPSVADVDGLEPAVAGTADDLNSVLHVDVVRGVDLGDEVVGHALRQRLTPDEDRDAGRELREVHSCLSGRVAAAHYEYLLAGKRRRFGDRGAVVHADAVEPL